MHCPNCESALSPLEYESITVETCTNCGGEWLDAAELGKINKRREEKFDAEQIRAIAESTTITGVNLDQADRDLRCPKCNSTTDAVNFGGDSGIVIDRCTACNGIWADDRELEKIQMLVEGWEDKLPQDLKQHGQTLRKVAVEVDAKDDVTISRLPLVGGWVNAMINGILDMRSR